VEVEDDLPGHVKERQPIADQALEPYIGQARDHHARRGGLEIRRAAARWHRAVKELIAPQALAIVEDRLAREHHRGGGSLQGGAGIGERLWHIIRFGRRGLVLQQQGRARTADQQ
jgi:hypothetical protein